ncbi:hypothetical protein J1N35_004982 [Gossypium stocksii]|uniref:Uncharacterized protein n=1 Tax=Gossypium stocksii TaxID=47602 RepID=A0A9D3WDU5_9ROSI|nr:hypothetical protein J1N35_004982 [Gossypium stocksii]
MDVPPSLKWKSKDKGQASQGSNEKTDMDIPMPKQPQNHYLPMQPFEQVDEAWEKKEEDNDKEKDEESTPDDSFNKMFRTKKSYVEEVMIRTPSHTSHTSSAGAKATTLKASQEKDPMIEKNRPDLDSD